LNLGDLASAFFILVIEISMSFAAFLGWTISTLKSQVKQLRNQ
jgi:hypothetical protein